MRIVYNQQPALHFLELWELPELHSAITTLELLYVLVWVLIVKAGPPESSELEGEEKPIWGEKAEERKNVTFTDYSVTVQACYRGSS